MKITILDGYPLNPGDLDWGYLEKYGDVTVHERTAAGEVAERAAGATAILTNKVPLGADVLRQLPDLRYIGVLATGYNIIDTAYAKEHGIVVTNVPGYSTPSVAQLTFALLLELCHHVQRHSDRVKAGKWSQSSDFSFWDYPLLELAGKTMGIVGFGDIGKQVADIAAAFGMQVVCHSRTETDQSHRRLFRWVGLDELLELSDVVSLHCPLTPQTQGLIDAAALAKMKSSAFLLNTSRGPLVDEDALAAALNAGKLAGAGVDVLAVEPPKADNPLFAAENCLVTPHIAWATKDARARLMGTVDDNLKAYLAGSPINVVNR